MVIIRKDEHGLYARIGGYIVRPESRTKFVVDDRVKGFHFGGSTLFGVGKDEASKRGEYLEYWRSNSIGWKFTDQGYQKA